MYIYMYIFNRTKRSLAQIQCKYNRLPNVIITLEQSVRPVVGSKNDPKPHRSVQLQMLRPEYAAMFSCLPTNFFVPLPMPMKYI